MKKFMNAPEDFVNETLKGIVDSYPLHFRLLESDRRVILKAGGTPAGKVAIVTGGGSGHLPLFLGYVGNGLADACAVGNIFSSPGSEQILNATRAADASAGVLYLFGHYQGDQMNFQIAGMRAQSEGIQTRMVMGCDDIASAPKADFRKRRAIAGLVLAYRIAGAYAAQGHCLDDVARIADKVVCGTHSLGIALSMCIQPQIGHATFEIPDEVMDVGMGIHGEPGIGRRAMMRADEAAEMIVTELLQDMDAPENVAMLVNGLGATSQEELFILAEAARKELGVRNVNVSRCYIGNFATSLDMMGASITLLQLDEELQALLDEPCYSPLIPSCLSTEKDGCL